MSGEELRRLSNIQGNRVEFKPFYGLRLYIARLVSRAYAHKITAYKAEIQKASDMLLNYYGSNSTRKEYDAILLHKDRYKEKLRWCKDRAINTLIWILPEHKNILK